METVENGKKTGRLRFREDEKRIRGILREGCPLGNLAQGIREYEESEDGEEGEHDTWAGNGLNGIKDGIRKSYRRMSMEYAGTDRGVMHAEDDSFSERIKRQVRECGERVREHPALFIFLATAILLIYITVSLPSAALIPGMAAEGIATYPAEDHDLTGTEEIYSSLEDELAAMIYSTDVSSYDEAVYETDGMGHKVHEILSAISAKYPDGWDDGSMIQFIKELFACQYRFSKYVTREIRYRYENVRKTAYVSDPGTGEIRECVYYEPEKVPYVHSVITVVLENRGTGEAVRELLSDEEYELYEVYLSCSGNREDLFPGE